MQNASWGKTSPATRQGFKPPALWIWMVFICNQGKLVLSEQEDTEGLSPKHVWNGIYVYVANKTKHMGSMLSGGCLVQSLAKAWQTREQRTPIPIDFVSIGDVHGTHVERSKYRGNGVNSIESPINCAWKGWSTLQTKVSYTNYHQQHQHQLKPPKSNTKHIRVCSTVPILTEKKLWVSSVAVQTALLGTIAHQGDMRSCKECVTWRCMVVKDNGTSHKRRYLLHCVPLSLIHIWRCRRRG